VRSTSDPLSSADPHSLGRRSAQRTAMGCHEADVAVDVAVDEGQAFRPLRYLVSFESKGRDSATMVERKARNLCNRGLLIFNHIPVVCRPCHRLHRHLDRQDGHAEHDAHQYRGQHGQARRQVRYASVNHRRLRPATGSRQHQLGDAEQSTPATSRLCWSWTTLTRRNGTMIRRTPRRGYTISGVW
jgi:hypothetical protein